MIPYDSQIGALLIGAGWIACAYLVYLMWRPTMETIVENNEAKLYILRMHLTHEEFIRLIQKAPKLIPDFNATVVTPDGALDQRVVRLILSLIDADVEREGALKHRLEFGDFVRED